MTKKIKAHPNRLWFGLGALRFFGGLPLGQPSPWESIGRGKVTLLSEEGGGRIILQYDKHKTTTIEVEKFAWSACRQAIGVLFHYTVEVEVEATAGDYTQVVVQCVRGEMVIGSG